MFLYSEERKSYAQMDGQINRKLMVGWAVIVAVLLGAYLLEIVKGERTVQYFFVFLLFTFVPFFVSLAYYLYHPETGKLKYLNAVGYFATYAFVMATGNSLFVFTYIFPMLALIILYHDRKLILWMGAVSLAINAASIGWKIHLGQVSLSNSRDVEIQVACIILMFAYCYMAAGLYDRIHSTNGEYVEEINHKSELLQDMVMQTITTIAKTIDAKDEYTEGHSQRVAQYSRQLALELGKSEDEAENIYYIALLHDIGKIGIPDTVLHKPGRLSNEEFGIIKQHPLIGAEILKDVRAFPGLEIGAHYHHERYDGRGYPEGIGGKDIPEAARIICVADSYDAMNSNRVYRHHFKKENIVSEIENCRGTQFDPVVADAMVKLLREDRLEEPRRDDQGYTERRKASGIETSGILKINKMLLESLADDYSDRYLLETLASADTMNMVIEEVTRELASSDGIIVLVDVDNLRDVNREYGYLRGDYCLAAIAEALVQKEQNMLTARVEGDEFVCFIQNIDNEDEARERIERLIQDVLANVRVIDGLEQVTISVGAAYSKYSGNAFYRLLPAAEKALYNMKSRGGDGFEIFHEDSSDNGESAMEKDLDNLTAVIEHKDSYDGALNLDYEEFGHTLELLKNIGKRDERNVQLVLFSVHANINTSELVQERNEAMNYLKLAINSTVRKVDVTTRYSSSQQLVLFLNLSQNNLTMVVNRIIKEFYRMNPSNAFQLVYASRDVSLGGSGETDLRDFMAEDLG